MIAAAAVLTVLLCGCFAVVGVVGPATLWNRLKYAACVVGLCLCDASTHATH